MIFLSCNKTTTFNFSLKSVCVHVSAQLNGIFTAVYCVASDMPMPKPPLSVYRLPCVISVDNAFVVLLFFLAKFGSAQLFRQYFTALAVQFKHFSILLSIEERERMWLRIKDQSHKLKKHGAAAKQQPKKKKRATHHNLIYGQTHKGVN